MFYFFRVCVHFESPSVKNMLSSIVYLFQKVTKFLLNVDP